MKRKIPALVLAIVMTLLLARVAPCEWVPDATQVPIPDQPAKGRVGGVAFEVDDAAAFCPDPEDREDEPDSYSLYLPKRDPTGQGAFERQVLVAFRLKRGQDEHQG